MGVGFPQASAIDRVARDFPQLRFAIIDMVVDLPNVQSFVYREHEGAFLVGMLAAMASKKAWCSSAMRAAMNTACGTGMR